MYTQCPECKKQRLISVTELRNSGAMISCSGCSLMFDALEFLNDDQVAAEPKKNATLADETTRATSFFKNFAANWGLVYTLCIIIFIFQIYFFEGYNLTQNTIFRPWLKKACGYFNCQLPPYKNLNDLTILHGSFEPMKNEDYIFKAAFTNQSAFEQNYPSIKLTLLDYTGNAFAERIFHPQDYLIQDSSLIMPEMSAEITMEIAAPPKKIGGYRFEFIY